MRVSMLAYTFYEEDTRVMRYAESLASLGHTVDIVALRNKGQINNDIIRGVHLYRIQERIYN